MRWYTLQRLRCLCAVGIAADTLTFSGICDLNYTFLVSYGNKVVCKGCIQQDSHATTSSTLVRMATHSYLLKGQSRQPRTVNLAILCQIRSALLGPSATLDLLSTRPARYAVLACAMVIHNLPMRSAASGALQGPLSIDPKTP